MVSKELLEILVCPETKQPVHPAPEDAVRRINQQIRTSGFKNRAGIVVQQEIDGLLIREDRKFGYAIREDIPVMLIEEGLPLE